MAASAPKLNLFLRGSRDYIQGTQIIARLAEQLPPGDWRFEQANFQAISTRELSFAPAGGGDETGAAGRVSFSAETGEITTYVIRESGPQAPRRDAPMPIKVVPLGGEGAKARWRYEGVATFEDVLNVLVQAIKAENAKRWPEGKDIWFTGARRARLPLNGPFVSSGEFTLTLYRQIGVSGQVQTIWQTDFPGADPAGMITFTLKLPG
ncbi:MAG: hypothetical protein NW206_19085 [Hyphomonadaceae bacterium]|nr:hypothetical protein [Hyphomonadaceae bacterium]